MSPSNLTLNLLLGLVSEEDMEKLAVAGGMPGAVGLLGYEAYAAIHGLPPLPKGPFKGPLKAAQLFDVSPSGTPQELFIPGTGQCGNNLAHRFIRRTNPNEFLIYTDGLCLDNGKPTARAGRAFIFRSADDKYNGACTFKLEQKGPTGETCPQTSNRAELRAVIAALQYRTWVGERWTSLVIATDSEYVVKGTTVWVSNWLKNGWRTSTGKPVVNRDLWELLLQEIGSYEEGALRIRLWRIPRSLNVEADGRAKEAAGLDEVSDHTRPQGVMV